MKALTAYIDRQNKYMALFRGQRTEPLYEVTTAACRQRVAGMIDSDLSPDNLSCVGELPRAVVNRFNGWPKADIQFFVRRQCCTKTILRNGAFGQMPL